MKIIQINILLIMLSFSFFAFSQNFKPLMQTPYDDFVSDLIQLENDNYVVLKIISGLEYSTWNYITHSDVDGVPLSVIQLLSNDGSEIRNIGLPDTDSTVFWASNIIKLNNGTFCVAGDFVNTNNNEHHFFYAIINSDITNIDFLKIYESTNDYYCNSVFEYQNGDLVFLIGAPSLKYIQYTIEGLFVKEFYINNITCPTFFDNKLTDATFNLDNNIFVFCQPTHYIRIDGNFNYSTNTINSHDFKYIRSIGRRSINHQSKLLFSTVSSLGFDTISAGVIHERYPMILSINEDNETEIFFSDTNTTVSGGSFAYHKVKSKYVDNVYAIYFQDSTRRNFVLYSLNGTGEINWKKYISLNDELDISAFSGKILGALATNDKGFLFTYSVDDENGKNDVYYCKINQNGNIDYFYNGIYSKSIFTANDFLLFPTSSDEYININTSLIGKFNLQIYNVEGKKMDVIEIKNNSKINISSFNLGIYYYKIIKEAQVLQSGKFMKQ